MSLLRWTLQNHSDLHQCGPFAIGPNRDSDGRIREPRYELQANGRTLGLFNTVRDAKNYVELMVGGAVAFTDERAYWELQMAEAEIAALAEDTDRALGISR